MNRAEMPEPMRPQLDFIRRIVPMMGLASLGVPDTEADDLMACYTKAACAHGDQVILATNDKDLFQLVDGCVKIYSTNKSDLPSPKDSHALLGADAVRAKWGVDPQQIGDVLALIGDSVDNIPGVPGFGPKTAVNLLNEFGSLDAVLADLSAVKNEKLRAKLEASRPLIEANREMVRLDCHLTLPLPIEELVIRPRYEELIAELRSCEFKGLLAEVEAEAATSGSRMPAAGDGSQGELF